MNRALLNTAWISSGLMMPMVEVTTMRTMTAVTWNRYGRNRGTIRPALLRSVRAGGVVTMTDSFGVPRWRPPATSHHVHTNPVAGLRATIGDQAGQLGEHLGARTGLPPAGRLRPVLRRGREIDDGVDSLGRDVEGKSQLGAPVAAGVA